MLLRDELLTLGLIQDAAGLGLESFQIEQDLLLAAVIEERSEKGEKEDEPAGTDFRLRNFQRSLSDVYRNFQTSSRRPQPSRSTLSQRLRHRRATPTPTSHRRLTPRPAPSRSDVLRHKIRPPRHRRPCSEPIVSVART
jgi:hypothetical protein